MPKLTLATLLHPAPTLTNRKPPGRICLMRHAFRGYKEQLEKVEKWTGGVRLTVAQAYPPESETTIGTPSSASVLNAVRLNRKLARLVSADQSKERLYEGDLVLAFASTGGRSAEFLAAFEVRGVVDWEIFHAEYQDLLIRPPLSAQDAGLSKTWLARGMGYNALPTEGPRLFDLIDRDDILKAHIPLVQMRRLAICSRGGVQNTDAGTPR